MPAVAVPRRSDVDSKGRQFDTAEREKLVEPHLQSTGPRKSTYSSTEASNQLNAKVKPSKVLSLHRPRRFRQVAQLFLHKLLFFLIQLAFSIYIRFRQTYHAITDRVFAVLYYHHRTPELIKRDVKDLPRLPNHLSVIIELSSNGRKSGEEDSIAQLIGDVAEISAWCACAGIPMLSVYERTGVLKSHMPSLHSSLYGTFHSYFPPNAIPNLHIRAPNLPAYSPPSSRSPSHSPPRTPDPEDESQGQHRASLNVLLLSATDGRATLVDLTKTLAEMSQRGKLKPSDISTELVDAEVTESSCGEPDLLIIMAPSVYRGRAARRVRRRSRSRADTIEQSYVNGAVQDATSAAGETVGNWGPAGDLCLRGYPPWQVRLTEIFNVQDNSGVDYQVFLRGLYRYAKAEMRFGR